MQLELIFLTRSSLLGRLFQMQKASNPNIIQCLVDDSKLGILLFTITVYVVPSKKALLLLNTSPRSWHSKIKTLQTVPFLLFSILWYFRLVAWAAVTASAELAARLVRPPRRKDAPQIGLTSTASKTMAAENSNLIWFDTNTYSSFSWLVL